MQHITQSSNQLQTIFGSGYVLEQHDDELRRYLPRLETSDVDKITFEEVMKVLRSALSIR